MLQIRSPAGSRAVDVSLTSLATFLNRLSLCPKHAALTKPVSTIFVRHASHASQGRANGPKDSAGRRLGAKKTASEYVIPGNIIFKQRGSKWHPGENVGMGKDHTIYATEYGYVRYYQDPARHPKRRYIGVALDREGKRSILPTPRNAPTRRRLGMYAAPIKEVNASSLESHMTANSVGKLAAPSQAPPVSSTRIAADPGLSTKRRGIRFQRESNWEIGDAAEKKGVTVRPFDRKDRWYAWRIRAQKQKRAALARAAKATRKSGKGKKAVRKVQGGPVTKR